MLEKIKPILFLTYIFFGTKAFANDLIYSEFFLETLLLNQCEQSIDKRQYDLIYTYVENKNYKSVDRLMSRIKGSLRVNICKSINSILVSDINSAKKCLVDAQKFLNESSSHDDEELIQILGVIIDAHFRGLNRSQKIFSVRDKNINENIKNLTSIYSINKNVSICSRFFSGFFEKIGCGFSHKFPSRQLYLQHFSRGQHLINQGKYAEALIEIRKAEETYPGQDITYAKFWILYEKCRLLFHLGRSDDFKSLYDKLLQHSISKGYIVAQMYLKSLEAESLRMSDFVSEAETIFYEVLNFAQHRNYDELEIISLVGLGDTYRITGKVAQSEKFYERALLKARENSNEKYIGAIYRGLGILYFGRGEYKEAEKILKLASINAEKEDDYLTQNKVLINLGSLYLSAGDINAARASYERALLLSRETSNPWVEVQVLTYLADIERISTHNPEAIILYKKAIKIGENINDRAKIAMCKFGIGILEKYEKNFDAALIELTEAEIIYKQIDHKQGCGMCSLEMAEIYSQLQREEIAEELYVKAILIFGEIDDKYGLVKAWRKYSKHQLILQNQPQAMSFANKAFALAEEIKNHRELAKIEILYADIYMYEQLYSKAIERLESAISRFSQERDYLNLMTAYQKASLANSKCGYSGRATELSKKSKLLREKIFSKKTIDTQ